MLTTMDDLQAKAWAIFNTLIEHYGTPTFTPGDDPLDELIATWTASHDLADLEAVLNEASVPATRIFTMADIFADPHFDERQMLVKVPHETLGDVTMAGVVPKLSRTPGALCHSGGHVGKDTRRVLTELVGLSPEDLQRLRDEGVIDCRENTAPAPPAA